MLHPPSLPPQYLASRKYPLTQLLDDVIQKYLPVEKLDRQNLYVEETQEPPPPPHDTPGISQL